MDYFNLLNTFFVTVVIALTREQAFLVRNKNKSINQVLNLPVPQIEEESACTTRPAEYKGKVSNSKDYIKNLSVYSCCSERNLTTTAVSSKDLALSSNDISLSDINAVSVSSKTLDFDLIDITLLCIVFVF